jgi:uncharacterized protein (TIGR00255 family)
MTEASATAAVSSMTGFARHEGGHGAVAWVIEARSVNGRALDIRCRLPTGFDRFDPQLRTMIAERFRRGSVTISLQISQREVTRRYQINRPFLERLLTEVHEIEQAYGLPPQRLDALLAVHGVVGVADQDGAAADDAVDQAIQDALTADFQMALDRLMEARRMEGERLRALLSTRLLDIGHLTQDASTAAAARRARAAALLQEQVAMLLEARPPITEDRLAAELAVLATKQDVREETDRLKAHVDAATAVLAAGGPVGRRLDFLCQEFNREANTLCSKSQDIALTAIGLNLKMVIDQIREQVQNLE